MADTQLGAIGMGTTKTWDAPGEELELCEEAVKHINRLRPAFVIVCGDLTDAWTNGVITSDDVVRQQQVADFKKAFDKVSEDIPFLCVCGNHDVGNRPTPESMLVYRNDFGDDYYEFTAGIEGCRLRGIVINSNFFYDSSGAPELHSDQMSWIQESLERFVQDRDAGLVQQGAVFMHHPLFLKILDEPDDLGNWDVTLKTAKFTIPRSYFHLPLKHRQVLGEQLLKHGIKIIFSGHYHQNVNVVDKSGLEQVVTSAVGLQMQDDRSGFRIVTVSTDSFSHEYYAFDQMPEALPAPGL